MDVNSPDWSQAEFKKLAENCENKEEWKCLKTDYACKDYLCPFVRAAADMNEVRAIFKKLG